MEISYIQPSPVSLDSGASSKQSIVRNAENGVSNVSGLSDKQLTARSSGTGYGNEDTEKQKGTEQAENLHVAVSQMNDHVQNLQRNLLFTVDEATGENVVTVVDSQSEEVIRQIPSEEALSLARRLAEYREDEEARLQLFSTLA